MAKYSFSLYFPNRILSYDMQEINSDISIIEELNHTDIPTNRYEFASDHINSLSDPVDIWKRGLGLLNLYNGVNNLIHYPEKTNSDIYEIGESKLQFERLYDSNNRDITPKNSDELIPDLFPFCSYCINRNLTDINKPKNSRHELIFLSRTNDDVLHLLQQLGNGLSWSNLYCILDTLKTYSKKKNITFKHLLKKSGSNENEVKRFSGTVNNYGILGPKSRHGFLNYQLPQQTMTLSESKSLILSLCRAYFELKYSISIS